MRRTTSEIRTEFTVGGASNVVNAAKGAAKAFDGLAESARRQAAGAAASVSASNAAAAAARRMAADLTRAAAEAAAAAGRSSSEGMAAQVKAAQDYAASVGEATAKARKHYEGVAQAAKEAVRASERAGDRKVRQFGSGYQEAVDEKAAELAFEKSKRAQIEALKKEELRRPKANAPRSVVESYEGRKAQFDEATRAVDERVRAAERELAQLRRAGQAALEDERRRQAEAVRVVREAEDAKVAAAKRTLDERRRIEAEAVLAAKKAADEQASAAKRAADAAEREARRAAAASDRATRKAAADASAAAEARSRAASGYIDGARAAGQKIRDRRSDAAAGRREMRDGMANPAMARMLARGAQAAYEAAVDNVVRVAEAAQARLAGLEGAALRAAQIVEQARVKVAADGVVRAEALMQRKMRVAQSVDAAIRKSASDTARAQEKAAQDAARESERSARRAAKAWRDSQARIRRLERSLPSLFGNRPGLYQRLLYDGSLSMVGGIARSAGRLVGMVFGAAGTVGRLAFGALSGIAGAAGRAAGGILSIGVSAVSAAARMATWLGSTAVAAVARLGTAAAATAAKVASIAKTILIRAVVVGGGLAAAGYGLARKATGDAAEASKAAYNGAITANPGMTSLQLLRTQGQLLGSYQTLRGAAKRAGVDMDEFNQSISTAQEKFRDLGNDPILTSYFKRLAVGTRMWTGHLRDSTSILRDLLPRVQQLMPAQQWDLLERIFGSPEQVAKLMPFISGMMQLNDNLLGAGAARQMQLGSMTTQQDVIRQRAHATATYDLKDAYLGLKLAVARTVGNDVIRGMVRLADLIARNRGNVAILARAGFNLADAFWRVVRHGEDVGRFLGGGAVQRFVKGMLDATLVTRTLAVETYRAFRGIREQQTSTGQVYIEARQGVVNVVAAVFRAQRALQATVPFFREAWAAIRGRDGEVVRFGWMLDVQRFAKDMWRTLRGDDDAVSPNHAWMLALREDVFAIGRFAREAWRTIRGDTDGVTEFPILLRIRSGIQETFSWIKSFVTEAWTAITGGAASSSDQFPWMQNARREVLQFVEDVRAAWNDLQSVWDGADPATGIGAKLAALMATVAFYRDQGAKLWEDLKLVFTGSVTEDTKLNFPALEKLGQAITTVSEHVQKAYDLFSGLFKFLDSAIERFTFGKIDLATVALVTGFATLFGVTRVVVGGLRLVTAGVVAVTAAMTTAAVAAGASTAAGAGAGLAGALGVAGTAAQTAGRRAGESATLWGRLKSSLSSVAGVLARSPALVALLGLGGFALGNWIADQGEGDSASGQALKVGGGALAGAAAGAGVGALVGSVVPGVGTGIGAAVGGVAGGIYGAFAGNADYYRATEAVRKKRLREAGRGDLADLVESGAIQRGPSGYATGVAVDDVALNGVDAAVDEEMRRLAEDLQRAMAPVRTDLAAIREGVDRSAVAMPGGPTARGSAASWLDVEAYYEGPAYTRSPRAVPAPAASSVPGPQAALAPTIINIAGLKIAAYQDEDQKRDLRSQLDRAMGSASWGAGGAA